MSVELFLGLIFLLFWLLCETICVWLILKEKDSCPPVYGYGVGRGGSSRTSTPDHPNFYTQRRPR